MLLPTRGSRVGDPAVCLNGYGYGYGFYSQPCLNNRASIDFTFGVDDNAGLTEPAARLGRLKASLPLARAPGMRLLSHLN